VPTLNWLDFDDACVRSVAPLEDVLAAAAGAGFAHVGLDDVSVGDREPEDVAALLAEHGLRCTEVGVLRIGAAADPARLAALAAAVGACTCIAAVSRHSTTAVSELRAAADTLHPLGIRIALEHAAYSGLRTVADAVDVCAAVGWDRCGLLVDSWHVFRAEADPWRTLAALDASQIELVHLNDGAAEPVGGDAAHESRFDRLPPGRGDLDLGRFLDLLDTIGYDGVVSLEVLSAELRRRTPLAAARELYTSGSAVRSFR
jgi:sugar phosphate isomerase/epimerase